MQTSFDMKYLVYSSCMFVDGNGGTLEVDFEDMEKCKASLLGKTSLSRKKNRLLYFTDSSGMNYDLDITDSFSFFIAPYSAKLIDGINQSEARRRGLILFCFIYLNVNARVRFPILFQFQVLSVCYIELSL